MGALIWSAVCKPSGAMLVSALPCGSFVWRKVHACEFHCFIKDSPAWLLTSFCEMHTKVAGSAGFCS